LIAPDQTEPLARSLYQAVNQRLFTLPPDLVVYPTHGSGVTFCAAAPGGTQASTTIGRERASNPLFSAPDEDAFVEKLLAGYGSYPPYFLRLRAVNKRGPRVYGDDLPALRRLSVDEVRRGMSDGAVVIDARPTADFATGHIPGSLSNQLRPVFASWIGWLVPDDRPLIFVLNADQDRAEVVRQCLKIGYEDIAGELEGGIGAWLEGGLEVNRVGLVTAHEVGSRSGRVLDVRQRSEFELGHVEGAENIELGTLGEAGSALPNGPLTVMCGHGERAMTGASLLARAGRQDLSVLLGGPDDVRAAARARG
jgi:rhodanese-related sulfurtransferase